MIIWIVTKKKKFCVKHYRMIKAITINVVYASQMQSEAPIDKTSSQDSAVFAAEALWCPWKPGQDSMICNLCVNTILIPILHSAVYSIHTMSLQKGWSQVSNPKYFPLQMWIYPDVQILAINHSKAPVKGDSSPPPPPPFLHASEPTKCKLRLGV